MNARGSTEVIVATIGLSVGALTHQLYTMIVTMAVITTMAMPPMLRWALGRLPVEQGEAKRLAQEAVDAKGFAATIERLLVAADDSANGHLAAQLASRFADRRGIPLTVLGESAAQSSREAPGTPEVTRRQGVDDIAAAVAEGAEKGFGLLFVLAGRGGNELPSDARILIPVDGTDAARQGAEIAFAVAPRRRGRITALHTAEWAGAALPRGGALRRMQKEVMDDVAALARRHGFVIEPAIRDRVDPATAILETARRVRADLVVVGTERRVGETLFLGATATSLLMVWDGGLVLLAV
jgi:nucleotide-binding universal stress UspA family protein